MAGTAARVPLASAVFDWAVEAAGLATLALAAVALVVSGQPFSWRLLLCIPVVAIASRFPLTLLPESGSVEIGLDSAVLVYLASVAPTAEAVFVWSVATVATQMSMPKHVSTRLFNSGLCVFAGGLAVVVMQLAGPLGETGPHELVGVASGCVVYFLVDVVITGISLALLERVPVRQTIWDRSMPIALICFVGIDALGYVAALVTRYAGWALPLIAAPVVGLLLAARAFSGAHEDRVRMRGLFDAAAGAQASTDPDDIVAALLDRTCDVLRCPGAELRATPPTGQEIGVAVGTQDEQRWLIATPRLTGNAFGDEDRHALEAIAAVAVESLARIRLMAQMAELARSDPLTGLANRTLLRERVEHAVSLRARENRPLAVLYCDLDGFKGVNDSLGHEAGDELLVAVAGRLLGCTRPGDTVARLGGDEFAVILEDLDGGRREAEAVAQRLLDALAQPFRLRGSEMPVSASVGIALRDAQEDATELLRNADVAMYQAKAAGKNRYAVFAPHMLISSLQRLELESQLRRALDEDGLVLHYQPVVRLDNGEIDGVEALLRWQHPDHGLLGPAAFIEIAEETGLIDRIGSWVLRTACADARAFAEAAGRPLSLAVNVSARQLLGEELIDAVEAVAGDPAFRIVLEITESVLVREAATVTALQRLRESGVKIAVDDFGTGYSSIAYLRELPVDILKLDRSFVGDAATDARAAGIVRAIVTMAGTLSLVLVAEGIEDLAQAAMLRDMGCRLGQGYQFAHPMPADEVPALIAAGPVDVAASVVTLHRPQHDQH